MHSKDVVQGSISSIAQQTGRSEEEVLMEAKYIIALDVSSSMHNLVDQNSEQSRYDAAVNQLISLQNMLPGKIGVVSFSSKVDVHFNGIPPHTGGTTSFLSLLDFLSNFDDGEVEFYIISDGEDFTPELSIKKAEKFNSKINTIFIGSDDAMDSEAKKFLKRLSEVAGGEYRKSSAKELKSTILALMPGGQNG